MSNWVHKTEYLKAIDQENTYCNSAIIEFLDTDHNKLLVGSEGSGKTLIMRLKRQVKSVKGGTLFIPNFPMLDVPEIHNNFSKQRLHMLRDIRSWENLWKWSIVFSILTHKKGLSGDLSYYLSSLEISEYLKSRLKYLVEIRRGCSPSFVLSELLAHNISTLYRLINEHHQLLHIASTVVRQQVNVFIDGLDKTILSNFPHDKEIWVASQAGLAKAALGINISNRHLKIFASIREDAYIEFDTSTKDAISSSCTHLTYDIDELKLIFFKRFPIEVFKNGNENEIFEFAHSSSFFNLKNLLMIGEEIVSKEIDVLKRDITSFYSLLPLMSSIFAGYLYNKQFLTQTFMEGNIVEFLSRIPSNIIKGKTLKMIADTGVNEYHPSEDYGIISQLIKLGLITPMEIPNQTNVPSDAADKTSFTILDEEIYVLYSGLIPIIQKQRSSLYKNGRFMICNIEKISSKAAFPLLFISHSSLDKSIIEPTIKKIEEKLTRMIPFDIWYDKWSIRIGEDIHQEVEKGVETSDLVLLFVSKNSLNSGWVNNEWRQKHYEEISEKKTQVISIIIYDTSPDALPYFLKRKKAAILNNHHPDSVIDQLVEDIYYLLQKRV